MSLVLSRSQRKTEFWSVGTPQGVGPGTYQWEKDRGSTGARLDVRGRDRGNFQYKRIPGPGTYEPREGREMRGNIRGSLSFISRQARLTSPHSPGPGPGTYSPSQALHLPSKPPDRIKTIAHPTIPSIPLSPHTSVEVSPTSYCPSLSLVTKRVHVPVFRDSADDRVIWPTTDRTPGPGAYTPCHSKVPPKKDAESAVFLSKVPQASTIKTTIPGPGSYDPPLKTNEIMHEQVAGFNSSTSRDQVTMRRFKQYKDVKNSQTTSFRPYTQRRERKAPFDSLEVRECMSGVKQNGLPGPGTYTPDVATGQADDLETLKTRELTQQPRFQHGLFQAKDGPAPGEYFQERRCEQRDVTAASFKSRTRRFQTTVERTPAVGTYNLLSRWGGPQRDNCSVSFETSALRFDPEEVIPGAKLTHTPGPGQYEVKKEESRRRPAKVVEKRFKEDLETHSGPGMYFNETTMIKKTFNFAVSIQATSPKLWTLQGS